MKSFHEFFLKNSFSTLFICLILLLSTFSGYSQFCSGTLGAPIVNITFGSGAGNPGPQLSAAVPGASTNYNFASYATGSPLPPPLDGDYALLNKVPSNSGWLTNATDHTGDPNGYMAFFNAAPTPGNFYQQTVANLCSGTTYEFAAWATNVINPNILPNAVTPNLTFKILNPNTQAVLGTYNTGNIASTSSLTWKQYSMLFTVPAGLSSVVLVISNNNIGGTSQIGNDLAIDDITFRPCGPKTNASFSGSAILSTSTMPTCGNVNLFGSISGGLASPVFQWQISTDNGITFTNITNATLLNYTYSITRSGNYQFRLVSAESGNIASATCSFISDPIKLTVQGSCSIPCNTWLKTTAVGSSIKIGDLDVSGNHITVEASFNRIVPYTGTYTAAGDIVSKHNGPFDGNYLLRPNSAEITTSNGYFVTPKICDIEINKTYHAALVYDGSTLKFYRNGFLMSQTAATGNLYQNDWITTIGDFAPGLPVPPENLIGYINEVRIWNVARTQSELKTYMNTLLPNPVSQAGLLACYSFDDLKNKQGNSIWNGVLTGNALINQSNTACIFVADSCKIPCYDSVTFSFNNTQCNTFSFKGFAYPLTTNITKWQWDFGDGSSASTQNCTHLFTQAGSYTIKLTATDINGCSLSKNVTLIIPPGPALGNDKKLSKCIGTEADLTSQFNTVNLTASWLSANNPVTTPAKITQPGTYELIVMNTTGCSDTAFIDLTDNPKPDLGTDKNILLCTGKTLDLTSYFITTNLNSSWTFGGNPVQNPTSVNTPGQYRLIASNSFGCSDTATLSFANFLKPNIQLIKDSTICKNSSIQLTASGAASYNWSPAISLNNPDIANPVATPSDYTIYYLNATDLNNCIYVDSVRVSIHTSQGFTVSPNQTICSNSQQVQLSAAGGDQYIWTPAALVSNPTINNPSANITTSTTFSVLVKENKCNEQATLFTTVTISPEIKISAGKSNDIDCTNTSSKLSATGGTTYLWSPATELNNPYISNPVATIASTQKFYVKGTNDEGCFGTDSIIVYTNFSNPSKYLMPNAFSPNGDGLNDCFRPSYWGSIKKIKFSIYNRFGQLVFYTENPDACWNGFYKNKKAEAGNYVYHIIAETACGNVNKKDNFILIR